VNWSVITGVEKRISVFCRRPEECKKPQKQVRETVREVLVQMWTVCLYTDFVDDLFHSL